MSPEEARATALKVERVFGKHERGEPLTEDEWLVFQYARHTGGCHACGSIHHASAG